MAAPQNKKNSCVLLLQIMALVVVSALRNQLRKMDSSPQKLAEEQLQTQLTAASVIYHLIGIFYNE